MRERIEACPCCGGPGKLKDSQGRQVRQGWVGCPACGLYISWKISPDGAVRKWNRRAWSKELTPEGRDLVIMLPGAVNSLARKLIEKLEERILYGDPAEPPAQSGEAET